MISSATNESTRTSGFALLVLPAVLVLVFLALRHFSPEESIAHGNGAMLSLVAFGAFLLALGAAIKSRGHNGRAWLLLAAGSLGWAYLYPVEAGPSVRLDTLLDVSYALLIAATLSGVLMLCRFASDRRTWIKRILDTLPPAVALGLIIWVSRLGSFAFDSDVPSPMRVSVMIHGLGTVVLLVFGVAGFLSERRNRFDPAARLLLPAVTLLALADWFWLESLTGSKRHPSTAAMIAFAAAFALIGFAAIVAIRRVERTEERPIAHNAQGRAGWESQLPDLALAALLLVAGWQAIFGETVRYGLATTIAGALTMLAFIVVRQSIVLRRDRHLRQEIGQLSEQIDGLISQVGRDPLTGLLNHRAIHERIDHELANGRASALPVAVVLIDVDNFKTVNDTLGHQTGDRVLRAVSSILTAACRGTDVAARYAGDEFMLLLPGLNEAHAGSVCERIALEVRRVNDDLRLGHGAAVSLSVGVAVTHGCQRSVSQTVAIADAAMYDAKEGGKDRVVVVNADTLVISETYAPVDFPDPLLSGSRASFAWGEEDRRVG
jgi:diguanylate cyclase (GGDEF)-like protein